ncbi:transporter substrate-binding domain-containing diguanylate cyclase [Allochromatium palmeri]|uniref:diguanylate cyclase n=1 Tax=Allochromatium palmeri TaxID=231048 RepID=A0A6N8EI15_9GAMM|nr:transporter substrate-binding domain-containing protein [Allochromatium palmeri]MTW21964.1 transporter substrate-binding domain-containing protein [Allochromatium palmeri]
MHIQCRFRRFPCLLAVAALLCAMLILLPRLLWAESAEPDTKVQVVLSDAEQAFLRQHPSITLGTDESWEPYVIAGADGRIRGYDANILERVNALTGANFQLVLGRWSDMLEAARERRIDGLSSSAVHDERRDSLSFSTPYISLRKMLLVAGGNPANIRSTRDLVGKTLVIQRGNLADEKLARSVAGAELMLGDGIKETILAVDHGEADATFGNIATLFAADRLGLPTLEVATNIGESMDQVFSVRNDWPEALSILNKGLDAIPQDERLSIQRRWFLNPRGDPEPRVTLNAEERGYLLNKERLRLCVDPQWMPYEYLDDEGRYRGIIADIHHALAKRLDIQLEILPTATWAESLQAAREQRCDLLSAAVETPERQSFLGFTPAFLDVPLVIATRDDQPFIDSILDVSDKTFAMIRHHALEEIFRRRYPGIHLIEVMNPLAGLEAVREGRVFGFIDTSVTIGYAMRKYQLIDVKIAGKLDERYALTVGVRGDDPLLLSIYRKAVESLPEQEVDQAVSRWTTVETVKELDRSLLFKMLGALGVIGLLLLYRERVRSGYNRRLREANRQLEVLSTTDQLTGVANRRKFAESMAQERVRAERYGSAVSLIIADIDHFKTINDSLGHDAGDRVLIKFAQLFVHKSRRCDLVVRWGGEEFLMLCPQTDLESATKLAELLRQRVAESDFGIERSITSSFGVAQYQTSETINALVARADLALYRAKEEGRNRVCAA